MSSDPIELETKFTVSPDDAERILAAGRVRSRRHQLNIYFQADAIAPADAPFLRVRYETGLEAVATVKVPLRIRDGMREMIEIERPLSLMGPGLSPRPRRLVDVTQALPPDMAACFLERDVQELRRQGWMRNVRTVVEVKAGLLEVDRFTLPGGDVWHEVEIEHPDPERHKHLGREVRNLAPSAQLSLTGKLDRFLQARDESPRLARVRVE